MSEARKLRRVNLRNPFSYCVIFRCSFDPHLSGSLVDTGNVDSGNELNGRRVIGIVGSAMDVDTVYPVLVDALIRIPRIRGA